MDFKIISDAASGIASGIPPCAVFDYGDHRIVVWPTTEQETSRIMVYRDETLVLGPWSATLPNLAAVKDYIDNENNEQTQELPAFLKRQGE